MNKIISRKKRLFLLGIFLVLVLSFSSIGPSFADPGYHSEQDFIDRSDHSHWILDPSPKRLLDRQDIADNIALFRGFGLNIDENFAWYSNETTITVQKDDTRLFAYRSNASVLWQRLYPFFDEGVVLNVFEYNGGFIARVCGNFSPDVPNPPPPKISGHKYDDRNANGLLDIGDPPLADWTIILYKDGTEVARTVTDANGYYEFILDARPKPLGLGVTPGTFTLGEVLKLGWKNTSKPKPVEVLAGVPGKNYSDNDFLNFKPGYISGYKWYDFNHNGTWEKDVEPALPGWEITLKDSEDNLVTTDDFGNPLPNPVKTNTSGHYKFSRLPHGTYTIHETLQDGWNQSRPKPPGYYTTTIFSQSARTGRNFGNWMRTTPTVTTKLSQTEITLGESITDEVTVTGAPGLTPTGTVTFEVSTDNGVSWIQFGAVKALDALGKAISDPYTPPAAGDYLFRAKYSGDSNYLPSQSADKEEPLKVSEIPPPPGHPGTRGYWANWRNHYTSTQMEGFLAGVNASSAVFGSGDIFGEVTLSNVGSILKPTSSDMLYILRAELLATRLNVTAPRVDPNTMIDLTKVSGAPALFGANSMKISQVISVIESHLIAGDWSRKQMEIAKNVCQMINTGSW